MIGTLWIALLGSIGVLLRYFIDFRAGPLSPAGFPLPTLLINATGSFVMGLIYVLGPESGWLSKDFTSAITVGLLGGFTTFSAFSIQTVQLLERGKVAVAAGYFFGSPCLGLSCALSGVWLARFIWIHR